MKLHFEDWTAPMFLNKIERNGLVHGGKIIKVYGNIGDPRVTANKPSLTVVESDDSPLNGLTFTYPDRGEYSGSQLESELQELDLPLISGSIVRALFRFGEKYGFRQVAMEAKNPDGSWLVDHPFGDIDGLEFASSNTMRQTAVHLDIFHPDSLPVLKTVVDYDNPDLVMGMHEAVRWRKSMIGEQ